MGAGSKWEVLVMEMQTFIELFAVCSFFFAFVLGYRQGRVG